MIGEARACLLDMDGVLADFVRGVLEVHGRPSPYTDPNNLGKWHIPTMWEMTDEEFWDPLRGVDFWANLHPTSDCFRILRILENKFGDNIRILTSPNLDPECPTGKLEWVRKHIPDYYRKILIGSSKEYCARHDHLLIDDNDHNIEKFTGNGGKGILFPREWNSHYALSGKGVEFLSIVIQ